MQTNVIGDPNCFLFQLAPQLGVYLTTGYNQHYMYLQQNAQTMPNGLVSDRVEIDFLTGVFAVTRSACFFNRGCDWEWDWVPFIHCLGLHTLSTLLPIVHVH